MTTLPGFVDLQVNGFLGTEFSSPDLTEVAFAAACRALLERGTAAFLPTIVTSPVALYQRNLSLMAEVMKGEEFQGRLLGIHVEGPFISHEPGAVGAHNPDYVREPDIGLFQKMQDWAQGRIRLLTLAPELPGADTLARFAVGCGVVVSLGHTLADSADIERLALAGATALTHLGNGVPNMLPRHVNPIWAGLAHDKLTAMLITDGHHLPAPVLKTMIRAKGVDKIVIVSDASPIAGLPPGQYVTLDNVAVLEPSGRLYNPEKQCLVGSSATMLDCVNHLASLGILTPDELLRAAFYNPLRLIGVDPAALPAPRAVVFDDRTTTFAMQP